MEATQMQITRLIRPPILDANPSDTSATKKFQHWLCIIQQLKTVIIPYSEPIALALIMTNISTENYELISTSSTYQEAINILQKHFVKPTNTIVARHRLMTEQQSPEDRVEDFYRKLNVLATDCNFRDVDSITYKEEYVRDAFISGLRNNSIRTRLLEKPNLTLTETIELAKGLETASINSKTFYYADTNNTVCSSVKEKQKVKSKWQCYFCGSDKFHLRQNCPAKNATCKNCFKLGHMELMCKSMGKTKAVNSAVYHTSSEADNSECEIVAAIHPSLLPSSVEVTIKDCHKFTALCDTGATENFVSEEIVKQLEIPTQEVSLVISMADTSCNKVSNLTCIIDFKIENRSFKERFIVLPNLCSDLLLGLVFLRKLSRLTFNFGGLQDSITIGSLPSFTIEAPRIFSHLSADCKPIATKSRKFNNVDSSFIQDEIRRMLQDGIIEPSSSPWRAQVHIVKDSGKNNKRRLVIDYSRTINKFTYLDAYPSPKIEDLVHKIASYKVFSTIDLKSAYHCVPLHKDDKIFTAFEANNQLYQFTRLSFGLTNGVSCFQRVMNSFIQKFKLKDTFAYLDDLTICGINQEEHDLNLANFLKCAKIFNMTFSKEKCKFSLKEIKILGYLITQGNLKPDPDRFTSLIDFPNPSNHKSLQRLKGLFAYYSKWVPNFSKKIQTLTNPDFPLQPNALKAIQDLKKDIVKASLNNIDESLPFEVTTDASDSSIAATLSQKGRPVAFFSRSLCDSEKKHCSIEKEASAIIEAVKTWRHFLIIKPFSILTDQRSLSYIFETRHTKKIKNDKLERWRLELMPFKFEIKHLPGKLNVVADTLSRKYCASSTTKVSLLDLHNSLCHPGVTRFYHFIKTRNLPYSLSDVKQLTGNCKICAKIKPTFAAYSSPELIKAMRPMDRISIDFKGPLPCGFGSKNRYLFIAVDEYSRFPFAFACSDLSTKTVLSCLRELFSLFGFPLFVHSDRGTSFMSREVKDFLLSHGVSTSRSTPYHPTGNSQCERYVGIVWKTIQLYLASHHMPITEWEKALPDSLHSIRSLLCTSTNSTPHEKFLSFPRKSFSGTQIPSWLTQPGKVLLRKFVRASDDPLVQEVELIETNPHFAHIKYPNGKEDTVSIRDLAQLPLESFEANGEPLHVELPPNEEIITEELPNTIPTESRETTVQPETNPSSNQENLSLRRSERVRKPPDRWGYSSF